MQRDNLRPILIFLGLFFLFVSAFFAQQVYARSLDKQVEQLSPIHPGFAFLDSNGENVLGSGEAVSTMQTCGQCHDTGFISSHSFHADLGLNSFSLAGHTDTGRAWDQSSGLFGKWNPLTYRYLSPEGDTRVDLRIPDWIIENASRIVGGGPAEYDLEGKAHLEQNLGRVGWDWQASGVVEMNCFLCHMGNPNNALRIETIERGEFKWANTATLVGTGLVEQTPLGYAWQPIAFDEQGEWLAEAVSIQDPTNENCAQCHGVIHQSEEALALNGCELDNWQTATTGQVISPARISNSGLNLTNKAGLTRSWDIHAERGLQCTDCHYSLNNPAYYQESPESRPGHLLFDPRRLEIGEYLEKPNHNLARGQSTQSMPDATQKGSMRRCESCHNATDTHAWLPFTERHMAALACESCHAPQMYAPAVQSYDWTVLNRDGSPLSACRGVEGNASSLADLVTGFTPVLMQSESLNGEMKLAPYHLVSAWYWVYDSANGERPVRQEDLYTAFFMEGVYAGEIMRVFDDNQDGELSETELVLNTAAKHDVIAGRLSEIGLENPRISGEIQPYSINHNVTRGEWAVKDCQTCHSDTSRVTQPMQLATYLPGGVEPAFVLGTSTSTNGKLYVEEGALYYQPSTRQEKLYIFGHDRLAWIDWLGVVFFVSVLGAVGVHGGLRYYSAIKAPRPKSAVRSVYMYGVYERFWHWLQTMAIILLLLTGLVIHRPDVFSLFSFRHVVFLHNVLAGLLVANAGLSLFYHLASGEIRQFIPRPYGFFDQAILQTKFYLQGIFKEGKHPFEKSPEKKLNPLQQVTYFGILNVLLPLQIMSGALMWGVQQWPEVAGLFGGLPFLAPLHSLVAWVFASFIVGHVYLTTTGPAPLASMRAMIMGWDEVEVHEPSEEEQNDVEKDENLDDSNEEQSSKQVDGEDFQPVLEFD